MAVLTSLLDAWCTTARFTHEVVECWFCGDAGADHQRHYFNCTVLWRWLHDRLFYGVVMEDGMALFLRRTGRGEMVALRAAVAVDAALHAFNARRGGNGEPATRLFDARFKEARRRHKTIRALLYGVPGVR